MKNRHRVMLPMAAVLALTLVAACGGGGGTTPETAPAAPSETPAVNAPQAPADDGSAGAEETEALPEIVDLYSDYQFKYADVTLYRDDSQGMNPYALVTNPAETCGAMFGIQMPQHATLLQLTQSDVQVIATDDVFHAWAATPSEVGPYDMWGYDAAYGSEYECVVTFSSGVMLIGAPDTIDFLGFGCIDLSTNDMCLALYARAAADDFSSVAIKGAGGPDGEALAPIAAAVQSLLDAAGR